MIYQQVTLSGDTEWPKVADTVIEAMKIAVIIAPLLRKPLSMTTRVLLPPALSRKLTNFAKLRR